MLNSIGAEVPVPKGLLKLIKVIWIFELLIKSVFICGDLLKSLDTKEKEKIISLFAGPIGMLISIPFFSKKQADLVKRRRFPPLVSLGEIFPFEKLITFMKP
jgi:hypothetical protein